MKAVIDRHKPRRGSGFQLLRKNSRIDGIYRGKSEIKLRVGTSGISMLPSPSVLPIRSNLQNSDCDR